MLHCAPFYGYLSVRQLHALSRRVRFATDNVIRHMPASPVFSLDRRRPGEMLLEEFLVPLAMSQTELAKRIRVSYPRINKIINGKRGITPDTALRLARLFGTTPEFWLNGQRNWDLWYAMKSPEGREIRRIKPVAA